MARIVFVCVENSCRSQMAEGFARHYGTGKTECFSSDSRPSGLVNETAVQVMKEIGIDISKQDSKGFDALPYKEFDVLVTMGCGDEKVLELTAPFNSEMAVINKGLSN